MSTTTLNSPKRVLSTKEVASYLSVTERTIYVWSKERGMPSHKVGGVRRFLLDEVDEWIQTHESASASTALTK